MALPLLPEPRRRRHRRLPLGDSGNQSELRLDSIVIGCAMTGFFLWLGVKQFRRMEKSFADLI